MKASDPFPFLDLEEEGGSAEQLSTKWGFLEQCGVGIRMGDGIDFLLDILKWTCRSWDGMYDRKVPDIYSAIQAKLLGLESADRQPAMTKIR